MEYALLILGSLLLTSGAVLIYLGRGALHCTLLLLPGIVLCLVGAPNIAKFNASLLGNSVGLENKIATLGQDLDDAKKQLNKELSKGLSDAEDRIKKTGAEAQDAISRAQVILKREDTAPLRSDIQLLKSSFAEQKGFNDKIVSAIKNLEARAGADKPPIQQPNLDSPSASFTSNSRYSVSVIYKTARKDDSKVVGDALSAAGFRTSLIASTLAEALGGSSQPIGSNFILADKVRGVKAGEEVKKVLDQLVEDGKIASPVNMSNKDFDIIRGDVQVFLY